MVHHRRYFRAIERGITLFYDASVLCRMAHALMVQIMSLPDLDWEPFLRVAFAYFNLSCLMTLKAQSLAVDVPRPVSFRWSGLESLLHHFGGAGNFYINMRISVTNLEFFAFFFLGTEPIRLGSHKGSVTPVDAMAVTWYRLITNSAMSKLEPILGMAQTKISMIFTFVTHRLSTKYFPMLSRPAWLQNRRIIYNQKIREAGCTIAPIIGFIDGTRLNICRDGDFQECYYSGYTKTHCLLYISICFPDGTVCVRGPVNGRHNDLGALNIVGLTDDKICDDITTAEFVLGGDGIFQSRLQIETATDPTLSAATRHQFSCCRQCVEWSFKEIYSLFPLLRSWYILRLKRGSVIQKYNAACVLSQAYNTICPNQTSQFYHLHPPSLPEIFPHRR